MHKKLPLWVFYKSCIVVIFCLNVLYESAEEEPQPEVNQKAIKRTLIAQWVKKESISQEKKNDHKPNKQNETKPTPNADPTTEVTQLALSDTPIAATTGILP